MVDAADGRVVRTGDAPHPDGTEIDPTAWWHALAVATEGGLLNDVSAIAVAAQQHGMVTLDGEGEVVRPALLWNDLRSAPDAADLINELGGPDRWASAVGSVPLASFTVTKLRWLRRSEPDLADRVASVMLPHDWLTMRLTGAEPTTDRGDASGTGYFDPATSQYRPELLKQAFGRTPALPRVAAPGEVVGQTDRGAVIAAGTGDNMGAALGLGLETGDVVVSMGTSGTVFAVAEQPSVDPSGAVAGFADATGRWLPLVCTLNAARVLAAGRHLLGVEPAEFDALALAGPPGAGGLTLVPYLEGERTPNLPTASGRLVGLRLANTTREHLARAFVEGMLCGLADGLDALRAQGVAPRRLLLTGGAARSLAVQEIAGSLFDVPVEVPEPLEYVAMGAARQAAWAASGAAAAPAWQVRSRAVEAAPQPDVAGVVREAYAYARDHLAAELGWALSGYCGGR
ncbi:xylulokinase [Fodinicola feengrottensis]|uniref:Xylulose kinase n=1 Tax=Fodinicola feengrottensis TaxID=435914 RepID=A0ABP4S8I9_9ACTN